MEYVTKFLKLRCAGDVLNVVSPLGKNVRKEISETMAIIRYIKPIVMKKPDEYTLYDFCAGNALTSVLSVFLLPVKKAIAVDKEVRKRNWRLAKRFEYWFEDIKEFNPKRIEENSIIISIHPCSVLAEIVIDIFRKSKAEYLILMPCCYGSFELDLPTLLKEKLDAYEEWCLHLYNKCKEFCQKVNLNRDKKCLSPKNIILTAQK